ncbi:MAG: biopolymer transporter ExbD [Planctomycetota bacterium]
MRRRLRHADAQFTVNMTPMIDIVFLLIIFFLLVAQISRHRSLEMELPRLLDAVAAELGDEAVAIVNVVPADRANALGGDYRLGSDTFRQSDDGLASLGDTIAATAARQPELLVLVRAARTENYARVYPALRAVADAGVSRVHLVTVSEDDE